MRNDELFSPNGPDNRVKKLVMGYAMRGILSKQGTYYPEHLLARQFGLYEEWLAAMRESTTGFDCGFYEWLGRDCDAAFVFKPGDLVKHNGRYCVVVRRRVYGTDWVNSWRLRDGKPTQLSWPQSVREVELSDYDGDVFVVDVLHGHIEMAGIPPEVFELACEKAKNCPMMGGVV